MVLRPKLNMYCQCAGTSAAGGKCKRPTICAEKVCTQTVDADFVSAFVADFDELDAKLILAEQIDIVVPPDAVKPTVQTFVEGAGVGGAALTGCAGTGEIAPPTVVGSNVIGTMTFSTCVPASTLLVVTYGTPNSFMASQTLIVNFFSQYQDIADQGYVVPIPPVVVSSDLTGFSVFFPDLIPGENSVWGYTVTPIAVA